eukprot:11359263-Ditylum_brightwellii.AAC.1
MGKEGINTNSSMLKEFTETCVCYEECKPKSSEKTSAACKSRSERGGKLNAKHKASKRLTIIGDKTLHDIIPMTEEIIIASAIGSTCHEREDRSHKSKK